MKPNPSAFARTVREIVSEIPAGKVLTYGDVASLAGFPAHSRLVGKVLAGIGMDSNVPCHRVINAQGRTAPHWHSQTALLRAEGIIPNKSGRINLRRYRWNCEDSEEKSNLAATKISLERK